MKLPNFTRPLYGLGEHNNKNFLFLFLNFIGTVLSDLTQKISPTIGKLDRKIRSMKFETVRIHFLNNVLVCCHPENLLRWQRDVTTSPLYSAVSLQNNSTRLACVPAGPRTCLNHLYGPFVYTEGLERLRRRQYKTNCTHSIFGTIEARASLPQQIKNDNKQKTFLYGESPSDGIVQSVHFALMWYAG